jgi:hypothetical protein
MLWSAGSARLRAWASFVVVGSGGVIAGLLAGWTPSGAQTKDLSAAQVVAFRFPSAWSGVRPTQAPAVTTVPKHNLFDPNPTYALASADSQPVLPSSALAYADTGSQTAAVESAPAPAAQREVARPAERRASAIATAPKAAPAPRNNSVLFNDAQLASIKERLRLTSDQEYYWPQVEAALRAISYRMAKMQANKAVVGAKAAASIDPNSAEVQQLKSAAIPLIMSMREEQKREVRALARLMGLEAVASAI